MYPTLRSTIRGRSAAAYTASLTLAFLALVVLAVAPVAASPAPSPAAHLSVPDGWEVTRAVTLAEGVEHFQLHNDSVPLDAQLVRAAPGAGVRLRAVVSHDRISGPGASGERTSSMCARTTCLAAVNADFARLGTDRPVGAVVSNGRLLSSPVPTHHQFSAGWLPLMSTGTLEASIRLVTSDLRQFDIAAVNVGGDAPTVLHTPAWGAQVTAGPGEQLLVLRLMGGGPELAPGETRAVEVEGLHPAGAAIGLDPGTLVVRIGTAAGAQVSEMLARIDSGVASDRALLRVETSVDARESVGGTPVLVRDGRVWVARNGTEFNDGRHPRTSVGWDASGRVLLLTVDGRQPGFSVGMSLPDLAGLLVDLGAVEALNLDGGGSTTMVVRGAVANRPSDRLVRRGTREVVERAPKPDAEVVGHLERPVSTGLVLVTDGDVVAPTPAPDPLASGAISLPPPRHVEVALPAGDPASISGGDAPALLAVVETSSEGDGAAGGVAAWIAVGLLAQLAVATLVITLGPHSRSVLWGNLRSTGWPVG